MTDYVNRCYPIDGALSKITGGFGADYGGYKHRGVDFGVTVGTPVYAPQEGRAIEVFNPDGSFGRAVVLDHEGTPYYAIFAHLSRQDVGPGNWVFAGQQIGLSGNTGLSTGPHLHWQMSFEPTFPVDISRSVDPLSFPFVPLEEDMTLTEALEKLQKATADAQALNAAIMMREDLRAVASGEYERMKQAHALLKGAGLLG